MQRPKDIFSIAREEISSGMLEFLPDASYTADDVKGCLDILDVYFSSIVSASSANQAAEIVRQAVLSLNRLNAQCNHELIETDQREDICIAMMDIGSMLGFNGPDEDPTSEWREW